MKKSIADLQSLLGPYLLVKRRTQTDTFQNVLNAWLVHGVLESRQNVIHVVVGRIEDFSSEIRGFDIELLSLATESPIKITP